MVVMPTTADDDEALLPSSCLSASAQTRILIWRSEVASSFDPPHLPPSSASTSSTPSSTSTLGATTTTTTTTTTATTSSSLLPRPSRSRRFWRRIVRRLSLSRPGSSTAPVHDVGAATVAAFAAAETAAAGGPLAGGPPTEHDRVLRTAMYRSMPPLDDPFDDEQPFDVAGSDLGALRQKQERLGRAARLLQQQQQNAMGSFAI